MIRKMTCLAVLFAALLSFAAFADVTRPLTAEESAAVTAYMTERDAAYSARNLNSDMNKALRRSPYRLCAEYERVKINIPNWSPGQPGQRWLQRPKFPGWDDPCYTWYPNGTSYQSQLKCSKCGGKFVNPNGAACARTHPIPVIDQWTFTVRLIADDHKKPMEAIAHLKAALDHEEITEAQFDECMAIIDGIVAAATPAE